MSESGTRPFDGWHHGAEVPDDAGWWDDEPEYGLVYESPDAEGYLPEYDTGRGWPGESSRTVPDWSPRHRRERRFPGRLIGGAVLILAAITAITVVVVPRHGAARPSPAGDPAAGNPAAGTSQRGPGASAGPAGTATPATGADGAAAGAAAPAAGAAAITRTEAQRILSRYWRINNLANQQRSSALLGTIEAGSSYRLDTGAYRFQRAASPSGRGYVPFAPVRAAYYIPRQSARSGWPHWFAAAVTYAALARPQHATGSGYLLFTQASPGAAWKEVLEPYTLTGSGPGPVIATDAQGYALAVSKAADSGLAIAPGQIGPVTAAALDGTGPAALTGPANLADLRDQAFWHSRLPAGSTVTDRHLPASGPVFGLRTVNGGALLFYPVTARLTLAPPAGQTFQLTIPGYYSPSQTLTSARVGYIEQFATYDPPRGKDVPRITADASSIAARD
jgi:hypothetical protein